MKGEEKTITDAARDANAEIEAKLVGTVLGIMDQVMEQGVPIREATKISDKRINEFYSQAYRLYNTGQYANAITFFRLLLMLDPSDGRFYLGLAACLHMMKEYKAALEVYMLASFIDLTSPLPYFHASDCMIKMGDVLSAISILELAVGRSEGKPEYQVLKDRSLLMIESLKKEMAQRMKMMNA